MQTLITLTAAVHRLRLPDSTRAGPEVSQVAFRPIGVESGASGNMRPLSTSAPQHVASGANGGSGTEAGRAGGGISGHAPDLQAKAADVCFTLGSGGNPQFAIS